MCMCIHTHTHICVLKGDPHHQDSNTSLAFFKN